jgi:hypothetical protein
MHVLIIGGLLRTTARAFFRPCGAVGPLRRAVFSD